MRETETEKLISRLKETEGNRGEESEIRRRTDRVRGKSIGKGSGVGRKKRRGARYYREIERSSICRESDTI